MFATIRLGRGRERLLRRMMAAILAAVMLIGVLPSVSPKAEAATWMDEYLNKMVDWGVMRGGSNGELDPDRKITRAEFVAMVNRAFGYTGSTAHPFTDVRSQDWYNDDIGIAYNIGYFNGTGGNIAAPNDPLTREQAVVILARNLMLKEKSGESLAFTDARLFSQWSRGYIDAISNIGVINGYPDGEFKPFNNITRGEAAAVLSRAIGNLVQTTGETSLGGVYGNVVINTSGVTLKDTIIAGDLYITGGIELGDIMLDGVTVLGRIVISGAGESHQGDSSIILRHVNADELLLDSIRNQFVTMRVEGDTHIDLTSVRTGAYLEDRTPDGDGMTLIHIDGDPGLEVQLAGNIKEVVNFTPNSKLTLAMGNAAEVTIDEKATGATFEIAADTVVGTLNLDVSTTVTGEGDVRKLNVNAPGSVVSMLPDKVEIRPGISAVIDGEVMDNKAAEESSQEPRLLAGYPIARDVAPTAADAVFSGNKRGQIHWALSALTDGSIGEDDLINKPSYSTKILQSGTIDVSRAEEEGLAELTGLDVDGSYYISAVMVDGRNQRSPVKVTAFTTPDNTVPAFAQGYPTMSRVTNTSAWVSVMATKSCKLYYAVLPRGSTAPTVQNFKSGSITGSLGFGIRDIKKNDIEVFQVNSQSLEELQSYELYMCLIDADGGLNSNVARLSFTTIDGTPPEFLTEPTETNILATSVRLSAAINERGTIYWVVVAEGEDYPKPIAGQTGKPLLTSDAAKLQVINGMNCLRSGSVAAQENRSVNINITGLEAQKGYDVYYLAQDAAGNSSAVKKLTIHTLDDVPPTATQRFTKTVDEEGTRPTADTDVEIVFDESVQDSDGGGKFYELYTTSQNPLATQTERDEAAKQLKEILRKDFVLYDASSFPHQQVREKSENPDAAQWIAYDDIRVYIENGHMVFRFTNNVNIKLNSGGTYYFQIRDIADTSTAQNKIAPNPTNLPQFATEFAQVGLVDGIADGLPNKRNADGTVDTSRTARIDMGFQMVPNSTSGVTDNIYYDVFLWAEMLVEYDAYVRVLDENDNPITDKSNISMSMFGMTTSVESSASDGNGWYYAGRQRIAPGTGTNGETLREGQSLNRLLQSDKVAASLVVPFPQLNKMKEGWKYEVALEMTQVGTQTDPSSWSDEVIIYVNMPAGASTRVGNLASMINQETWNNNVTGAVASGGLTEVGSPTTFSVSNQFVDLSVPTFQSGYPNFEPGDTLVNMNLMLNRIGTVYYVIAPMRDVSDANNPVISPTMTTVFRDKDKNEIAVTPTTAKDIVVWENEASANKQPFPPINGADISADNPLGNGATVVRPTNDEVYTFRSTDSRIKTGQATVGISSVPVRVEGLQAKTTYFVYCVVRGQSQTLSPVYCFQFTTTDVNQPYITLTNNSPQVGVVTTTSAELSWILYANGEAAKTMLDNDFSATCITDATKRDEFDRKYNTGSTKMKTIDALITNFPGSNAGDLTYGQSLFDYYASETAKENLYQLITTGSSGSSTGNPEYASKGGEIPVNTPEGTNQYGTSVSPSGMQGTMQYYFIAAARHTNGTTFSFKAARNIRQPDRTPPDYNENGCRFVVDSLAALINPDISAGDKEGYVYSYNDYAETPNNYKYRGSLTISFTEQIYQVLKDPDGNVTGQNRVTSDNIKDKLVARGVKITGVTVDSVITIDYEDATNNAFIMLFNEGEVGDMYGNTRPQGSRLILDFATTRNGTVGTFADPNWNIGWTN